MSSLSASTRRVLEAGLTLFARHGFSRTSMADIAREAGVARATLYTHFRDKRAVFEALGGSLVDDALKNAEAAWRPGASLSDNIEATILAKDLGFFRLMNATPHGAELLAVDVDLTRSHADRLDTGFAALLTRRAKQLSKVGATFAAFGGVKGFGAFLTLAGAGLKHEARDEAEYRLAVARLARVASVAALRSARRETR